MYEWTQFLGAEKEEEFEMLGKKNPQIKRAVIELRRISEDEENQFLYDMREKAIRDERSRLKSARKHGLAEGKAEGLAEGILKTQIENARAMHSKGIDDVIIAEITNLSIEEIHKLKN